jgi:glutamate N-acetyltransferase / amino-acid N-acetyltransferase
VSVTFPRGFRAAGTTAGMKPSGRPDMGLLVADPVQSVAGLFTTNAFAAAPVRLSAQRVSRGLPRAVVVNSGQANAGTGLRGDRDSERTTAAVADALHVEAPDVLACSTGVIGEPLHMDRYLRAIPELVSRLSDEGGDAFAEAILTTDVVPKVAAAERAGFRVGGCAKGVGMIAPDLRLATMLVFITTDAPVPPPEIGRLATETLEPRFESLTVDACTSTNDTVLLFASGAAGGDLVVPGTDAWVEVTSAVDEVATSLQLQLASDAEGANHVIRVEVSGAETEQHARTVAREIAESILVKTAIFGGDPNPGRILQAIGSSGVPFLPQLVRAFVGDVQVIDAGEIAPSYFHGGDEAARLALVEEREVVLSVTLGTGEGRSRMIGVDLSYDYVKINAEYTT